MNQRYYERMSPPEAFLIAALKDQKTPEESSNLAKLYREIGDPVVFECARKNKVLPMTAHALADVLHDDLPQPWLDSHNAAAVKTAAFFEAAEKAAFDLAVMGVRMAVIENGGVLFSCGLCMGCFASSDLEVLVRRSDLRVVDRYLRENGYAYESRNRCLSEREGLIDDDPTGWVIYRKDLAEGPFWLNVMWRPVIRRWLPLGGRELSAEQLLDRSVKVGSSELRVLSNEDQVLLCSLHTASHSYVRGIGLRLQMDVDRLVRRLPVDWSVLVERVKEHEVCHVVFPSLAIPFGLWNTPVPEVAFQQLIPAAQAQSRLLDVIRRASIFNRDTAKFRRLEFLRLEALLADNGPAAGLFRALFPPFDWMKDGYGFHGRLALPYYYVRRLSDLVVRRAP